MHQWPWPLDQITHCEEIGLLAHYGHLVPKPLQIQLPHICSINEHRAHCRVIEALNEADHARPAGGMSDVVAPFYTVSFPKQKSQGNVHTRGAPMITS